MNYLAMVCAFGSFIFALQYDYAHVTKLSNYLVDRLTSNLKDVIRNGDTEQSYPGCVNLSFAFVEGESLLMALKDVALSSGRSELFFRFVRLRY